jgi:hypothetical protein
MQTSKKLPQREIERPNEKHTKAHSKSRTWIYGAVLLSNWLEEQSQAIVIVFVMKT